MSANGYERQLYADVARIAENLALIATALEEIRVELKHKRHDGYGCNADERNELDVIWGNPK